MLNIQFSLMLLILMLESQTAAGTYSCEGESQESFRNSGSLGGFPSQDISQGPSACFHYKRFLRNVVSMFSSQEPFLELSNAGNLSGCQELYQ